MATVPRVDARQFCIIVAAAGSVGLCQPRSSSPRYFSSMRSMRRETCSRVSPRSLRVRRTASPKRLETGSACVRRGTGISLWKGQGWNVSNHPSDEHSTRSPLRDPGDRPRVSAEPDRGVQNQLEQRTRSGPTASQLRAFGCGAAGGDARYKRDAYRDRRAIWLAHGVRAGGQIVADQGDLAAGS